ncbi:MAG: 4Fe-4S binding protein [Candidatus Omnitrophica bacterium]|nr:4Fe-4S binding protein [Candidatus Omnitrophota bacterium]
MYRKFLRTISQGIFIFLFFYFFKKTAFGISENLPINLFFRIDLLMAIFTTISTLHFSHLFFPSIGIFFLLLFLGNFFCFWICPFGGIIDYINTILFRKKWKINIKVYKVIRFLKIFLLWGFLLTGFIAIFFRIPFLFWIFDPYVILMRSLLFKKILFILLIIILLSVLMPRFWCNDICPLGYLNYLIGIKLRNKIKKKLKNEKKRIFKTYWSRRFFPIYKK